MRLFLIFCFLFSYELTCAQLKKIPHVRQMTTARVSATTQIQTQSAAPDTLKLPFWDDFSVNSSSKGHVNDNLWQNGHSVWVNSGMGINPPTLNVATFDGLDEFGKPYSNVTLTKGYADTLLSQPIRMDSVPAGNQDSVFVSFYYQYQGNGEPPDQGDDLSLWFKKKDSTWIQVWSSANDNLTDNTKFVKVKVRVKDACDCFYDNFQFLFQNFARLSGQFDTWNLDYVYVNNGEPQNQYGNLPTKDFPDRAIVAPPTSMLKQYQSIPAKHLLTKLDTVLNSFQISVNNLREDEVNGQNLELRSHTTITHRFNKVISSDTSSYQSIKGLRVFPQQVLTIVIDSIPKLKGIETGSDSIVITSKIGLITNDNFNKVVSSGQSSDYDSIVYERINFRVNDTIRTSFIFTNYYAYDDGEAESAVTLTNPGNHVAYQFDMMYSEPDTLTGVDIYFPHVGDESNQVIHLMVMGDQLPPNVNNTKPFVLTQQDLIVNRTENNLFTHVVLDTAVLVKKKFFIGYRQNVAANIGVGFDGDSDSGDKIFVNLGAGWEPVSLHGNMLMRPVFGRKSKGPVTSIEEKKITFYPNPNHGTFYLSQDAQGLQIVDIAGRAVSFDREDTFESTQVTLRNPTPGIYLARYYNGMQWRTEKIMVLP